MTTPPVSLGRRLSFPFRSSFTYCADFTGLGCVFFYRCAQLNVELERDYQQTNEKEAGIDAMLLERNQGCRHCGHDVQRILDM